MKKFGKLIFILCLVAVLAVTVAACNEKDDEMGGADDPRYGITMPSSDIYTIGGEVPEDATEGTTITFTVTLNDPENSAILGVTVEPTFDASYDIASNNGTYSFVMPASPVKIIIDARAYAEVLSDGGLSFAESNPKEIVKNSGMVTFVLPFTWNYTGAIAESVSEATSSDQSVIPDNALELVGGDKVGNSAWIDSAELNIDTSKINPGTTWLEIYLKSDNTSSDGTVCVKVTVLPEKEPEPIVPVEKWTATIKFQVTAVETEDLYFRFEDLDHEENTDAKLAQVFWAPGNAQGHTPQYTIDEDNYVTLVIECVPEHTYKVIARYNDGQGTMCDINFVRDEVNLDYDRFDNEFVLKADGGSVTLVLS